MKKIVLCASLLLIIVISGYAQTTPPANLTATVNNSLIPSVTLAWQYDSASRHVTYVVYKNSSSNDDTTVYYEKIWKTGDRRFTDYHVRAGKTYAYYVTAIKEEVESGPSNIAEAVVQEPAHGIISGILVNDSTSGPLFRGKVTFISVANIEAEPRIVLTDSNGYFTAKLKTGLYFLFASAEGYNAEFYDNAVSIDGATVITVNADDSLSFTIGLTKKSPPAYYSVSGWVKNADDNPQKASVTAYIVSRKNIFDWGHRKLETWTDSSGNFELRLKENDTAVIYVQPRDRSFFTEYWDNKRTFDNADRIAVNGNVTGINVTLDLKPVYNNGITGSVMDSAGTMPLRARVFAYKKVQNLFQRTRYVTETDSNGNYAFAKMEPGNYILLSWAKGYKPTYYRYDGEQTWNWRKADTVLVTENEVTEGIDFRLLEIRRRHTNVMLYGNISVSAGGTLDGALTYALDANGEIGGCAVSDLDGSYEIEAVEQGNYTLYASVMNYQDAEVSNVDVTDEDESKQADMALAPDAVNSVPEKQVTPTQYKLEQNYPNPFNPATVISYRVPSASRVVLKVYNVLGNEVATLVNGDMPAGVYKVQFDGRNLSSGVYYIKMTANNNFISVKKMMLMK